MFAAEVLIADGEIHIARQHNVQIDFVLVCSDIMESNNNYSYHAKF